MKAVCIIGMPNGFFGRSVPVLSAVTGALTELGLAVAQINLIERRLPYYEEGVPSESFQKIAAALNEARNIIFAYNVTDSSPSAVMKVFLEYLSAPENKKLLENKNILNISVSRAGGEREAAEYVAGIVSAMGAFELTRICIGGKVFGAVLNGELPINAIEKYAEDYYRLIRQNRIFLYSSSYRPEKALPPGDFGSLKSSVEASMKKTIENSIVPGGRGKTMDIADTSAQGPPANDLFAEFIAETENERPSAHFDAFAAGPEDDIEELTKLFSTRLRADEQPERLSETPVRADIPYALPNEFDLERRKPAVRNTRTVSDTVAPPVDFQEAMGRVGPVRSEPVMSREKTCRQMTASLPHYFQASLAQDTKAAFQFNIFGEEEFSGYLVIKNKDSEYYDGQYDSPDITIISNASVWQNVMRGRLTAQKAFMTGQLKVRGNFMLLNRFDQLYKKMS